jgi:hypothetical protein
VIDDSERICQQASFRSKRIRIHQFLATSSVFLHELYARDDQDGVRCGKASLEEELSGLSTQMKGARFESDGNEQIAWLSV